MDQAVLIPAGVAFLSFLIIHFISFRFLKAEHLFKGILIVFGVGLGVDIIVVLSQGFSLIVLALSLLVYAQAAFVYVLCVFGPYETSIRLRLIRELAAGPLTAQELDNRYNEGMMLAKRLKRLLGGGDIALEGSYYKIRKQGNAFFLIDAVACRLTRIIQGKA